MNVRNWKAVLVAAIFAAVGTTASAGEFDLSKAEPLQTQQARVEKEFSGDGLYAEIEPEQQKRARELMRRMGGLVNPDGLAVGLAPERQAELFNLQEELTVILEQAAEDSRVVCRRERPVGSNRPVNICSTVAERRRYREGGQEMLRSIRPAQGDKNSL